VLRRLVAVSSGPRADLPISRLDLYIGSIGQQTALAAGNLSRVRHWVQ
jgi:hypothetical protein